MRLHNNKAKSNLLLHHVWNQSETMGCREGVCIYHTGNYIQICQILSSKLSRLQH